MLPAMIARGHLPNLTLSLGVLGAAVLMGVLAVVQPVLAIGGAIALLFVVGILSDLTVGVILFSLVAFMEVLPGVGELSFAKAAGAVLALSWVATLAIRHSGDRHLFTAHPGYTVATVLFVTWALAGALWAESSSATIANTQRYALNIFLVFIIYTAIRTREHALWLAAAFVLGVLLSAGYGLFISAGDADAAAEGRLSGADTDSNYLATWLVGGSMLALALAAARLNPLARGIAVTAAVLCCLAAAATVSRTGLIALVVAMLAGVVFAGPRRKVAAGAALLAIGGAVVLYFAALAPDAARERVSSLNGGTGRNDIWTVGWRMVEAHPARGIGVGNFPISSVHYLVEPGTILRDDFIVDQPKVAHNIYLEVLAEGGIIAMGLFLFIIGFSLRAAHSAAVRFGSIGDRTMELLSRGALVAMIALLTGSFFNSQQYSKPIWLLLAMGPALLAISQTQQRDVASRAAAT